jgi:hypothetical protein
MTESGEHCGMGKGKVCVFLLLVGIGLLCVLMMVYTLFYARPHTDPTIQNSPHSSALRLAPQPAVRS